MIDNMKTQNKKAEAAPAKVGGWKVTEELDAIQCPLCHGYNRLSVSSDKSLVYCAECGDTITVEYLATQGFSLVHALQRDAAPASCGQHTTLESGEPIQSCLVAIANEMGGCDSSADLAEVVNLVDKLQGERDQLREDKAELLAVLREIMKCNHALGAISRPIGNEARAALARAERGEG